MPGQTVDGRGSARPGASFNGGPDNCPARRCARHAPDGSLGPTWVLQWRAGQLPGQTAASGSHGVKHPSMEGRTIARPDYDPPAPRRSPIQPSMEGRTIARPDRCAARHPPRRSVLQWRAGQLPGQRRSRPPQVALPSMEGRTIARPDRPRRPFRSPGETMSLQWRAGQLPGQTRRRHTRSLQWRAGQLPGTRL